MMKARKKWRLFSTGNRFAHIEQMEPRIQLSGELFVVNNNASTVDEYSTTGALIQPSLISGLSANTYASDTVSGSDLFIANYYDGTLAEYTTAGVPVNAQLLTGLQNSVGPFGVTVVGSDLYLANGDGGSVGTAGTVSQYTLGSTPGTITASNPALITGLSDPDSVTISGSDLFVTDYANGTVGEYTTSGGIVNTELVSGLDHPQALVLVGSDLFVTSADVIGEYSTSGQTINASLVAGISTPCGIATDGTNLFVDNAGSQTIGEYTTAGVAVNATLISGLSGSLNLAFKNDATVASTLAFSEQPAATITGQTLSPIIVSVEDSNGILTANDNSSVTLTISSGTLTGTTTVAAVNGLATFSDLSIATPGVYTLTASDGSNTPSNSGNFSIYTPPKTVGAVDSTYGVNGLGSHDVGFTATDGTAQDGAQSVIVGTVGASPSESFGVTRYHSDGSLDTAFGTAGVVSSSFAGTDDVPGAVDVLASGDILVAGTATRFAGGVGGAATGSEFVVAEYTAAGALDTSFGGGSGFAMVSFAAAGASSGDVLKSMIVSSTGAIYLGGESNASGTTGEDFAIASLTSGGSLNTGFNTTGKELLDFSGGDDIANSLALQTNGDLVAAGSATITGITEIALARFVPTGVLDKHFGTKGTTTTNVRGVYDSASSVVIQPRGQIVIGGISATGSAAALGSDFVVARFTASGKIDKSFGNGPVITSFGQPSGITQIVLQPDGEIIASGKTTGSLTDISNLQLAVARYTTRGVLDTTFNGTGKNIVDLSGIATTNALPAAMLDAAQDLLGSAFNAFTSSEQGVVSITPGGEILDAGNSGANTVEAELIAAGVDLVTSLIGTIPTAITGGSKGAASVAIVEDGTDQATGSVTIDLQVAADALGDGATTFKTLPEKINLHQKQAHSYHLSFVYPTGLTAGNYYLVAVVDNGTTPALQDLNDENNLAASKTAVDIAPPFISIAGAGLSTSSTFIAGETARVIFTLANDGNVPARGSIAVDIILSTDQTTADGTNVDTGKLPVNLNPGKPHVYPLSFKLPTIAAGTYYLIAVIDPADSLGATDQTSSIIVDPTQVVVK